MDKSDDTNQTTTKKRSAPNFVTPEKNKEKNSTPERGQTNVGSYFQGPPALKPSVYLKKPRIVLNLMSEPLATLSLKHLASGLVTILMYNRWGCNREAYSFPIVRSTERNGYDAREQRFIDATGIWAVVPRRKSKQHNEPIYKTDQKTGGQFKESYFLTSMDNKDPSITRTVLQAMQQVRSKFVASYVLCPYLIQIPKCINGNTQKKVEIKEDFDETDHNGPQSLDHYILDEAIVSLLQKVWHSYPDKTFYNKQKPIVRDAFFSEPYPEIANFFFGYPLHDEQEHKNHMVVNDEFGSIDKEDLEQMDKYLI